ncbi:protein FAM219B isoform X3 [Saccopteryx leptura]|uniref:protein FAM219B isoform X3 n=1 Tax=Saccopteryx leptura TaxID=249018 RepID=UPI00339CA555
MAAMESSDRAARASTPGPWPGGAPGHVTRAAGPPSGRSARGAPRSREQTSAAVEKRGPYMVMRAPSIQAKLQKHRDLAKAVLRRKGMLGASRGRPDAAGKRLMKFNKGYTALSQSPDESLVSLNSDRFWAGVLWCVVLASSVLQTDSLHDVHLAICSCAPQASP